MTPPINPKPIAATLSEPKPEVKEEVKCTCGLRLTAFKGHSETCPLWEQDAPADNAQVVLQKAAIRLVTAWDAQLQDPDLNNPDPGDKAMEALNQFLRVARASRVAPSVVAGVEEKEDLGEKEPLSALTHVLQNAIQALLARKLTLAGIKSHREDWRRELEELERTINRVAYVPMGSEWCAKTFSRRSELETLVLVTDLWEADSVGQRNDEQGQPLLSKSLAPSVSEPKESEEKAQ